MSITGTSPEHGEMVEVWRTGYQPTPDHHLPECNSDQKNYQIYAEQNGARTESSDSDLTP